MWASSADMCDLWCKEAFSKNTQIIMWASSADMSNSWSEKVLSRITYFDHVGI